MFQAVFFQLWIVVVVKRIHTDNFCSFDKQAFHQVCADEFRGTGDQNTHNRCLRRLPISTA